MIVSAALLGVAIAVLLARPRTSSRLVALFPPPPVVAGRSSGVRAVSLVAAATAVWWFVGGVAGILAAVAVLWLGPKAIARLDDTDDELPLLNAQLPLALDLLAACLAGGAGLRKAVDEVASALPGPCGSRLRRVAAALAVGSPPEEAFHALGDDRGPAGTAARTLARAAEGGTPVAAAVARVAAEARRTAASEAERRARRAGVLAVGPLGACFLPAFVLLGIVPTAVGLAGPLLSRL